MSRTVIVMLMYHCHKSDANFITDVSSKNFLTQLCNSLIQHAQTHQCCHALPFVTVMLMRQMNFS
jgi:hypothetical protein